jgi:hypothetical protein
MNRNKTTSWQIPAVAVVATLVIAALVSADAFAGPSWRGGAGNITFQQWSFSDANTSPLPDASPPLRNDYGMPELDVGSACVWSSSLDGHNGVWAIRDNLDIIIPNYPVLNPQKEMWIEMTWEKAMHTPRLLDDKPSISITPLYDDENADYSTDIDRVDLGSSGQWFTTRFIVNIYPNPPSEWITISGDIFIDQVVIDTCCNPEPATLSLLGLGVMFCLKRKQRNQRAFNCI